MESLLPSHCYRDELLKPSAIVIHFISCVNLQPSKPFGLQDNWWLLHDLNCEPDARAMFKMPELAKRVYASYHCLIGRDGSQLICVPEDKQAYHAGRSSLNGKSDFNRISFGVSVIGTHKSKFTDAQYDSLALYCKRMMAEYDIPIEWIVGHEDVAPGRKIDPGIASGNFDMQRLKAML